MLNPDTKDAVNLVHNGLISLSACTKYGIKIDVNYCEKMNDKLKKRLRVLEQKVLNSKLGKNWKKIYKNKVNVNSDVQLANILFNKMKMPVVKKTKKDNPAVDAVALDILSKENPDISLINDYRKIYMAHNTFIKGFLRENVNGIIHPGFSLHNIKTYRSSSSSPNVQQMPKRDKQQRNIVRKAIRPRKGKQFIGFDFGGIEVRAACCITQDKKLIHDVIHGDMHRDMAIEIYKLDKFEKKGYEKELRFAAKNGFVFAQFYGDYYGNNVPTLLRLAELPIKGSFKKTDGKKLMTGLHLGEHLIKKGIKNTNKFTDHLEKIEHNFWKKRYRTYDNWKRLNVKKYNKKGYLHTVTGFTCQGLMSKNEINNYRIQGPAFHCLLKCFNETYRRQIKNEMKSKQIGQIHDEMLIEIDPMEKDYIMEDVQRIMTKWLPEQYKWINVPLEVEADVYPVNAPWNAESETVVL